MELWHKRAVYNGQITRGLRAGQAEAGEALLANHGDALLRTAYALCGDAAEAQAVTRETLLYIVKAAHRYYQLEQLSDWLLDYLLDALRRRARQRTRPTPPAAGPAAGGQTPEQAALWAALHQLPAQLRLVFVLRYHDDMHLSPMSHLLHIPESTIKARLAAALRALREKLPQL